MTRAKDNGIVGPHQFPTRDDIAFEGEIISDEEEARRLDINVEDFEVFKEDPDFFDEWLDAIKEQMRK